MKAVQLNIRKMDKNGDFDLSREEIYEICGRYSLNTALH